MNVLLFHDFYLIFLIYISSHTSYVYIYIFIYEFLFHASNLYIFSHFICIYIYIFIFEFLFHASNLYIFSHFICIYVCGPIRSMPFNMSRRALPALRDDKYYLTEKSDGTRYLMYTVKKQDKGVFGVFAVFVNRGNQVFYAPGSVVMYEHNISFLPLI